jgi:hypothetical protein
MIMTTLTPTIATNPFERARTKFRHEFSKGVKPIDGRQPIPDEVAIAMVQELNVPKDSLIGVYDAFLILSTHLKEQGYTNIVLLESSHRNLTSSQEKYYNNIKNVCEKSKITYYVPPMNNYNRCDMKFDVIIGNPPYQSNNGGGSQRGSTTNPLWFDFTKKSFNLLKEGGMLSLITPSNIVKGGDHFTKLFLGSDRQYDLDYVDFSADDSFKVGVHICRWVARNSKTQFNVVTVNDDRELPTDSITKLSENAEFDSVMNTMFSYGESLNFNQSNSYDPRNVKKVGNPDLVEVQTSEFCHPVNVNGKIKFSSTPWKNSGTWRVFFPQLQNPTQITVDDVAEAAPSTFTMVVDSEEEGNRIKAILDDPRYQWVIEQTRVSGRVTAVISKLPNTPIEEVLSSDQLSYIESQL